LVEGLVSAVEIMEVSEDVPLQVALSLYVKGLIRSAGGLFRARKDLAEMATQVVKLLLRVPKDKSQ
jgi:hypothetical protein